jgi:hypothetical protein
MQLEELEKQFNHQLSRHEMLDINQHNLWSSIERQLPPKEEEKPPLLLFLLARILIGLFLFGLTGDYLQNEQHVLPPNIQSTIALEKTPNEDFCKQVDSLAQHPKITKTPASTFINSKEKSNDNKYTVNQLPIKQLLVNTPKYSLSLPYDYTLDSIESKSILPQLIPSDAQLKLLVSPEKEKDHFFTFQHLGISYQQNLYRAKTSNYQQIRQLTETPINNWSVGIDAFQQIQPNIYVGIGLAYQQQWTRFNYQGSSVQQGDSIFIPQQILIDPSDLDSLSRWDWQIPQLTENRSIQHFNQFQSLSIPISLAYLRKANKWQYGLIGGLYATWIFQQKGKYITPSGTITSLEEEPSYSPFQFGAHISPVISYQFKPNIQIGIRSNFHYNFSNQSTHNELKQQSLRYGVSIGVLRSW